MKRMRWLLLLLLAGGPGCLGTPRFLQWSAPPPKSVALPTRGASSKQADDLPPPAVEPGAINENNLVPMFNAVRDEIDYDANHPSGGRPTAAGFTEGKP